MAERDYMRGEGVTPIQDMTTRQLRKYIRERTEEAQARLDSINSAKNLDIEDMPLAFQDQLRHVQSFGKGRSGGIKKDTSRMSKEEMAEYAYAVRDLNLLDTESKYTRDLDYKENKDRYTEFIKARTREDNINKADREYWKQFLTEKGNVKKSGYAEYKNFINFLRAIDEVKASYGYETIKDLYYDETDKDNQAVIADMLVEVFRDNAGTGLPVSKLVDIFNEKYEAYKRPQIDAARLEAEEKAQRSRKKTSKGSKVKIPRSGKKMTSKKSKQNIKTKTTGKMKNGSVREKQTTKKL